MSSKRLSEGILRKHPGTSGERKADLQNVHLQSHHLLGQTQPSCHSPQTLVFGLQRCGNEVNTPRYEGEAPVREGMDVFEQLDFLHR